MALSSQVHCSPLPPKARRLWPFPLAEIFPTRLQLFFMLEVRQGHCSEELNEKLPLRRTVRSAGTLRRQPQSLSVRVRLGYN